MERNGIPTTYHNYKFRSRLEAIWACFFDHLGWKWKYEPFDYDGYIPDFALLFPAGHMLAEVKPCLSLEDLEVESTKLVNCPWERESIMLGVGPLENKGGELCLGVMYGKNGDCCLADRAALVKCVGHYGFTATDGGWGCRVEHHPNERSKDIWLGQSHNADHDFLEKWALAQNMVQWAPKMFGIDTAVSR